MTPFAKDPSSCSIRRVKDWPKASPTPSPAERPRRVIYVSCDAATFARDLKIFLGHGFFLSDLRVFDLFPMTEHVELVALLDSPA